MPRYSLRTLMMLVTVVAVAIGVPKEWWPAVFITFVYTTIFVVIVAEAIKPESAHDRLILLVWAAFVALAIAALLYAVVVYDQPHNNHTRPL